MPYQEFARATGAGSLRSAPSNAGAAPQRLVALANLGASNSAITVMDGIRGGPQYLDGRGAEALEDVQFALGEGPCHDAFQFARPVVAAHLDTAPSTRWLSFADLAVKEGFCSAFAFPLIADDVTIGVLAIYERDPGYLDHAQRLKCVLLAGALAATIAAIPNFASRDHVACATEAAFDLRPEIHMASGMVSVQLNVAVDEALVRIRAHAYAEGKFVKEIADDVVARRLRFADS